MPELFLCDIHNLPNFFNKISKLNTRTLHFLDVISNYKVVNIAWQQLYFADKDIFAAYLTNSTGSSANTAIICPPQLQMLKLKIKMNTYYCTFPEMEVAYVQ